jgi:hypothetical protein
MPTLIAVPRLLRVSVNGHRRGTQPENVLRERKSATPWGGSWKPEWLSSQNGWEGGYAVSGTPASALWSAGFSTLLANTTAGASADSSPIR